MKTFFQFAPRNISPVERLLITRLEARRRACGGRLFALIADPDRRLRRICSYYLTWLRRCVNSDSNVAVGIPHIASATIPRPHLVRFSRSYAAASTDPVRHIPELLRIDPRIHTSDLFAIPRAIFFDAAYPDSLSDISVSCLMIDSADIPRCFEPYSRGIFRRLPSTAFRSLTLPNCVCLILGNPYRSSPNHFRRYWKSNSRKDLFLCIDPAAELAARAARLSAIIQKMRQTLSCRLSPPSNLSNLSNLTNIITPTNLLNPLLSDLPVPVPLC